MEDTVLYLALTSLICVIVFIIAVVAWMWHVLRTDKHEECVVCGKILKKCKDNYYVECVGQLCKGCFKSIYK